MSDFRRSSQRDSKTWGDPRCGPAHLLPGSQPDSPLSASGVTVGSGFGSAGLEVSSGRSPGEMNNFFCSPYFRTWTLG